MSECSSSSTDADQPGEKLDLSVSGLMVLLYASGNEGVCACGWWGFVCVYEYMHMPVWGYACGNAHLCTWKYFWNHLSDLKGDVTIPFWTAGCPSLGSIKQHRRKELQGWPEWHFMGAAAKETKRNTLKPSSGSPSCKARNSKDLSLLKIRRVWCVIEEGLLSSLVDPLVCVPFTDWQLGMRVCVGGDRIHLLSAWLYMVCFVFATPG